MRLYDMNTEKEYTLSTLKREYIEFYAEEPWNHQDTFTDEFFEIILCAINGRNDCEIVGPTPRELSRIIEKYFARKGIMKARKSADA